MKLIAMAAKEKPRFKPFHHFRRGNQCTFCRFIRALAFSGIGAWLGFHGATYLGASQTEGIIYAFFGALALVLLVTENPNRKKKKRD